MGAVHGGLSGGDCLQESSKPLMIRPDGPNAERLGMKQAYPACPQALTLLECRVGTWSANDTVAPSTFLLCRVSLIPSTMEFLKIWDFPA